MGKEGREVNPQESDPHPAVTDRKENGRLSRKKGKVDFKEF